MDSTEEPRPTLADYMTLRYSAGGHPLTRVVSQPLGAVLAWASQCLGIPPSAVTLLGLATFFAAVGAFVSLGANGPANLAVALLMQVAYAFDCADGQLARATARTSGFGAWLDLGCDYVRNVALGGAVAFWATENGAALGWAIAAGAIFSGGTALQLHTVTVIRHVDRAARLETAGTLSAARMAATLLIDTATVLLVLPMLRAAPEALLAYAALIGVACFAIASAQARRRLNRRSPGPA